MIKLNCTLESDEFYIDLYDNSSHRPWAILEMTKYGPRQFDIYLTKEQAETAAKHYGLKIIDKPV